MLSNQEKIYLTQKGFKQDKKKYLGFYFFEEEVRTYVLIPEKDKTFKLEIYTNEDGEDSFRKKFSNKNQTLEEFINTFL